MNKIQDNVLCRINNCSVWTRKYCFVFYWFNCNFLDTNTNKLLPDLVQQRLGLHPQVMQHDEVCRAQKLPPYQQMSTELLTRKIKTKLSI